jgi:threonylcarbamoyladenosine tRNA methylthiotransferase MtaB
MSSNKHVLIKVLGCKVNQAEAASISGFLQNKDYVVSLDATHHNGDEPETVIINTCCVTGRAEAKSRRAVKRLAEAHPNARIIAIGCLAEVNPDSVVKLGENVTALGTFQKDRLDSLLEGPLKSAQPASDSHTFRGFPFTPIEGRLRQFLKIQDGCSQRCSYCVVPIARGPSRSMPVDEVIQNAGLASDKGAAEIILTGVHLGCYGKDLEPRSSIELILKDLLRRFPGVGFRMSSIEPQEISSGLIELLASENNMRPHLHVPLQSGSDRILEAMCRPYGRDRVHSLLKTIKSGVPDICLGLDVIVGFPGESHDDFLETADLIKDVSPAYLHVFPFSPRTGAKAAELPDRPASSVVKERVETLRALSVDLRREFYRRFLGRTMVAVPESIDPDDDGFVTVRTGNYIKARVRCHRNRALNGPIKIDLLEIDGDSVIARIADYSSPR